VGDISFDLVVSSLRTDAADTRSLVEALAATDKAKGRELFELLQKPFAVNAMEVERMAVLVKLTRQIGFKDSCVRALKPFEPIVPWNVDFLRLRQRCYQANGHPYLARASAELGEFLGADEIVYSNPVPEAWKRALR